jgi:DNA-binding NarL/FixJ family response regulator
MSQRAVEAKPSVEGLWRWPLVGRAAELTLFETLLGHQDGIGIVLAGAAGVGKTRLTNEALSAAEKAGYAALRVTATEAGRSIPLGPFAHLLPLEADAATAHPAALLQLMRRGRAAITARENDRPLALFVDDAHLLDAASATLVQQLAAAREVTVIATVRTGEPVPDAVVALWKDHSCEYIELQPLSSEETGVLAESMVGGEVDGQTKHRLWEASRGLPLVVHELVLDGLERHLLLSHEGLWRWRGPFHPGWRLLGLIEARIGQLSKCEQELLEKVTLGEPLSWSLLEASDAIAADDLVRRGVLAAGRDGHRLELRLAHPLFGEAVRARLPATRATALQRDLADALEATRMRRSGDLLRYATWRLESGGTAPADVLTRSANLGAWLLDSVLAERLARLAVEAGGGLLAERALARALTGQERFAEAEAILLTLVPKARTDEERTWVALGRCHNLVVGFGRGVEAEAGLVEAARLVSEASLRRELELARCWVLDRAGRSAEAAERSAALANDESADLNLRLRAAGICAISRSQAGRPEDALALVIRWEAFQGQEADDFPEPNPLTLAQFQTARFVALLYTGRLAEAEAAVRDAYSRSLQDPTSTASAMLALGCGLVALVQGHILPAGRWFHEATESLREADPTNSLPWALALTAQALGQAGDARGARGAADAAEQARRPGAWAYEPDLLVGNAWAAAAEGALGEARESALAAADLAEQRGELTAAFLSAHELLRLGEAGAASARLARLAGQAQGSLVAICAEHAEAVLSGEAGRIEAAASGLASLGARLWAAEAESAAARAHRDAGREASARAAAARAALLLEHCEEARTPALAAAGSVEELTPREREIAALAAGGASNREIAARLVVSIRTVENHLQRAYRKLGVSNRRELPSLLGNDRVVDYSRR